MLFQCTSNFDFAVQIDKISGGTNNLRSTPQQTEQSALATFLRNILEGSNRRGGTCTPGGTCRTNVTVSSVPFSQSVDYTYFGSSLCFTTAKSSQLSAVRSLLTHDHYGSFPPPSVFNEPFPGFNANLNCSCCPVLCFLYCVGSNS